ncbi:MAG: hypothetical protein HRT87_00020 [Legionellales bacterium]|nr:hypothetical protein [Legionellales bacterium]
MFLDAPEILALIGIFLSCIVFYLYARGVNKEELTLESFMLSDRNLNKSQFSNTFAASSFSLAMNTMFLFANCQNYAIFMLIAPITYLMGHYIFISLIRKSSIDINDCRTVSDLCYKFFPSKSVAILITIMTLTSYIMLIFIELYIGSMVLTFFFPEKLIYQTLSFLCIGIIVLLYVRLGGYKALVRTDKWQLGLMMLATSLITIYAIHAPTINLATTQAITKSMLFPTLSMFEVITFMSWLTILNLLTPFAQVANWQRVAAAQTTNISWKGLIYGTRHVLVLFLLTLFGFMLLKAKGYHLSTLVDFLKLVKTSDGLSAYCIFPLMIVGFCSMVFSSADVAIISVTYALADKNSFGEKLGAMNDNSLRKTLTLLITVILMILTVIYWLQFTVLQEWLLPLIYVVCGQIAILTPLPLYILYLDIRGLLIIHEKSSSSVSTLLLLGILLSWFLLFLFTYISKLTGSQYWSQLSVPLCSLLILYLCRRELVQQGLRVLSESKSKTVSIY